jgi:hypothetical protein
METLVAQNEQILVRIPKDTRENNLPPKENQNNPTPRDNQGENQHNEVKET